MKDFLGKQVKIRVDGVMIAGTVVQDLKDRVIIKGSDNSFTRVIKGHISMFTSSDMGSEYVPVYVLACQNKDIQCVGVRYMKAGDITDKDYEAFMRDCPCRSTTCKFGNIGELYNLPSKAIASMIDRTIFGDYPEAKEEEKTNE